MTRTLVKVILADIIMAVGLVLALEDLGWRSAYAAAKGFSPSYSYSVFSQVFSLRRQELDLASPLTLDWVQLLSVALIVLNSWYLIRVGRRGRSGSLGATPSPA